MRKRQFLQTAAAALLATSALTSAHAQATPLKFQLDWRFEGPAALFVHPEQKGYFKDVGLDVNVEAASGAGAIQRVASGTHDLGFADLGPVHITSDVRKSKPLRRRSRTQHRACHSA